MSDYRAINRASWDERVPRARRVHLQCHIGTDTISLARLGARMTGLDFSAPAVAQAAALAKRVDAAADFVQADVYDAVDVGASWPAGAPRRRRVATRGAPRAAAAQLHAAGRQARGLTGSHLAA